jgi:hypothetical protein
MRNLFALAVVLTIAAPALAAEEASNDLGKTVKKEASEKKKADKPAKKAKKEKEAKEKKSESKEASGDTTQTPSK